MDSDCSVEEGTVLENMRTTSSSLFSFLLRPRIVKDLFVGLTRGIMKEHSFN